MHHLDIFIAFVEAHRYWGYTILFFAMIFEGELFLMGAGILSQTGGFHIFDAFLFAFAGALAGDILWYSAGHFLKRRYPDSRIIQLVERRVLKVLPNIINNPFGVIFVSKFLYGFNHSSIVVLGFLKNEFWHFFRIQFFATLLWSFIFITLGYIFGFAALSYSHRLNRFIVISLLCIIGILILERLMSWYLENRKKRI